MLRRAQCLLNRREIIANKLSQASKANDVELSRIQGSLATLARAAQTEFRTSTRVYHGLVALAAKKGVVVPGINDAGKENNAKRWAAYNEKTAELRIAQRDRMAERKAAFAEKRAAAETAESH